MGNDSNRIARKINFRAILYCINFPLLSLATSSKEPDMNYYTTKVQLFFSNIYDCLHDLPCGIWCETYWKEIDIPYQHDTLRNECKIFTHSDGRQTACPSKALRFACSVRGKLDVEIPLLCAKIQRHGYKFESCVAIEINHCANIVDIVSAIGDNELGCMEIAKLSELDGKTTYDILKELVERKILASKKYPGAIRKNGDKSKPYYKYYRI
jgi:hypothetical protein